MSTVKLKPTSPGRRGTVKVLREGVFKGRPYKDLVEPKRKISGRNNAGRITVRHRGGAHKRYYRVIDFKRPFKRISMIDSIKEHTGIDITGMGIEELQKVCKELDLSLIHI